MPAFTAAAFNINKSVDKFVDVLVDFFKEQDVNLKSPALDKPLGEASEMLKFRPKLLAYLKDQDYAPVPNSISRANFEKIVGDDDTSKVNVAFQKKLKELRDALPAAGKRVSSTTAEIWRRTDSSSPTPSSSRRLRSSNRSLSLPF